jgi:preprotein translocase subunit SecF
MSAIGRILRSETDYDFAGRRARWFRISMIGLFIAVAALGIRGLNLGIDFVGGTAVLADNPQGINVATLRETLTSQGFDELRIEELDDGAVFRVRSDALTEEEEFELVRLVAEDLGVPPDSTDVSTVGPTFGSQILQSAITALSVFLGVVVLFISFRYEFKMAVGAIAALLHDLLLTFGVYAIVGFEVTPATVVAILTILGYSLYDTVVVYDRINEHVEELKKKTSYAELVNEAMNEVLARSLATSLTSLIPVGSLLFVGSLLLGAGTLQDFALALFVGIAAGTYSSIFVAAPLLVALKERADEGTIDPRKRARDRQASTSGYESSRPGRR